MPSVIIIQQTTKRSNMSFDNKGNYPLDENINKNKISDTKNPVLVKTPKEK
jgi:hypothetical protein